MWDLVRDLKAAVVAAVPHPVEAVASAAGLHRSKVELRDGRRQSPLELRRRDFDLIAAYEPAHASRGQPG